MNILLVSYLFAPNNNIGAVRPTKLAKYLVNEGHNVDVITSQIDEKNDKDGQNIPNGIRSIVTIKKTKTCESIQKIPIYLSGIKHKHNCIEKNGEKRTQQINSANAVPANMFKRNILTCFSLLGFFSFTKQFEKHIKTANTEYDCIYSSFGPLPSLLCGFHMKKVLPTVKWICEFRDPVVVEENPTWFTKYYQYLQTQACKKADHIVAVSNGYIDRICGDKYVSKRHMIPNGYDTDDIAVSESCTPSADVIHITYVGALYEGKRKITPLFHILRELADAGEIDLNRICFDYAGREGAFLRAQAEEFCLSSIIRDHGVLSRTECLKLQFSSHLLVLSTWNNRGEYGVFPGKFLEYMLIGKPIISMVDGNLPNSEVSAVIDEGNFGVSYEAVRDKTDYKKLKDYLEKQFRLFSSGKDIEFNPNQEVLERYNYKNIIKQLEAVINER